MYILTVIPEEFKSYYIGLSETDQDNVIEELLGIKQWDGRFEDPDVSRGNCLHFASIHVVGNGKSSNGVQRFRCRGCKKSFSNTTGKVLYCLQKKNKLKAYFHCLLSGYSI